MARVEITMPQMGESITEGTVVEWRKKPGERIEQDETLLEIGTDKVDTDVPSPAGGIVAEILVAEGETVDVGTLLAVITDEKEEAPGAPEPAGEAPAPEPEPEPSAPAAPDTPDAPDDHISEAAAFAPKGAPAPKEGTSDSFFSPLVRSIAEQEGVSDAELESITGSGRDGRVTKKDVLDYVASRSADEPGFPELQPAEPAEGPDTRVVKMDRTRKIIAEHMVRSKATSPHVTSFAEVDMTDLVAFIQREKEAFLEREGAKLTYTPFFVHAAIEALREHPVLNASVDGDDIVLRDDFHINVAVAIGKTGLVAPVVRNAGRQSFADLARSVADVADRARNKKLQPDDLQGGTFTITNIGPIGGIKGTPIINQPQVAILAVGRIQKRPVVIEDPKLGDVIAVRQMAWLSLSYDHRIIDGAMASSFLTSFVRIVESMGTGS